MSAVRYPIAFENYHISILGLRNTFYMYATYSVTSTKLEKFSQTNNTPWDIAYKKLQPVDCSLYQIKILFCFELGLRCGQQDAFTDSAKLVAVGFI